MRLTIDADADEVRALLAGEAMTQEIPTVDDTDRLPWWLGAFIGSAATLCLIVGVYAIAKGLGA